METVKAYSDIVMKYLLGREEMSDSLCSFINAVLSDSGFDTIMRLSVKNPFSIKEFSSEKYCILDIRAEDSKGRQYDIEVQSSGNTSFINRSLYYWAKLYTAQIEEAEEYTSLKPVICINLLNFNLIENSKKYHSCYWISEKDRPELVLSDHLQIHYLEMVKIPEQKMSTELDVWLQYFLNEGKGEDYMEYIIKDRPELEKVHHEFKKFTADEKMRELYEARLKAQRDYASLMKSARAEGLAQGKQEGLEQGIKKGIEKGIEQTAKNMLKRNMSIPEVSNLTGLSEEKISSLEE